MPRIAQLGITPAVNRLYEPPQAPRPRAIPQTPPPPGEVSPSPLLLCPTPAPMASPEAAISQFYSRSRLPKRRIMPVVSR